MAKKRRSKKPNCNHPPDQREQVGSNSRRHGEVDHVEKVYRCKKCGCWKTASTHSDGAGAHEGRWNAPKVAFPWWMESETASHLTVVK